MDEFQKALTEDLSVTGKLNADCLSILLKIRYTENTVPKSWYPPKNSRYDGSGEHLSSVMAKTCGAWARRNTRNPARWHLQHSATPLGQISNVSTLDNVLYDRYHALIYDRHYALTSGEFCLGNSVAPRFVRVYWYRCFSGCRRRICAANRVHTPSFALLIGEQDHFRKRPVIRRREALPCE